jgi:hypothetical protein
VAETVKTMLALEHGMPVVRAAVHYGWQQEPRSVRAAESAAPNPERLSEIARTMSEHC